MEKGKIDIKEIEKLSRFCALSFSEAEKWFQRAAEQGHDNAQFYIGWCYDKGYGVPRNYNEAKKWYTKAADQGNRKAKSSLRNLKK